MKPQWFKGKRITVFGIGLLGGGVGTIRYLAEQGAQVIATDIKSKETLKESLDKLADLKNVTYILGQHRREDFMNVDMVIKTPSCPWTNEHVKIALAQNIPVETDASLFFQLCTVPIVGVTGTKGKTTTARMIYHLLKKGSRVPVLFGVENIAILDRLSYVKKNTIVVFELSSWRLSALKYCKLSPQIAVFTNIFPDHMNYYKSMESYFNDKKQIFLHQKAKDFFIFNVDDKKLAEIEDDVPSTVLTASTERLTSGRGVFLEDGDIYCNDGVDAKRFIAIKEIDILGKHNYINVLLAIGAVRAAGLTLEETKEGLLTIPRVPHRLEFVREVDGVKYYNDTAASNPESAVAGIETFSEPVILIAGGSDKNLPVGDLPQVISDKTKDVVFIEGAATDKFILALKKILPEKAKDRKIEIVDSMEKALEYAREKSATGDVILLSPGAASFGVFKNEFDRGNQFRKIVEEL